MHPDRPFIRTRFELGPNDSAIVHGERNEAVGTAGEDLVIDVDGVGDMPEAAYIGSVAHKRSFSSEDQALRRAPRKSRATAVAGIGDQPQRAAEAAYFSDLPDHRSTGVDGITFGKPG